MDERAILVQNGTEIQDPHWFSGFVSAEGSFIVAIRKTSNSKLGYRIQLISSLAQHTRDDLLIISLINYFNCGTTSIYKEGIYFKITKFSDICDKIIPYKKTKNTLFKELNIKII